MFTPEACKEAARGTFLESVMDDEAAERLSGVLNLCLKIQARKRAEGAAS